jgi:CubicO group peptidase (beta-lactamase class C family)
MTRALRWPAVALIILIAVASLPLQKPAEEKPDAESPAAGRWQRVQKMMQGYVDRRDIAGAVVLIQHRGKPAYYEAFGKADLEAKTPMSRDAIFRLASLTKPITSAGVLLLAEEGKLRLDDPVAKHLPAFADRTVLVSNKETGGTGYRLVKADRPLTIRHLLTHTSGIIYCFSGRPFLANLYVKAGVSDGLIETDETVGDNVKRIATLPLLHQPGTAWEYGLNTDVLARLIEVVSGKPLDEFCRERIFQPLQMPDTAFLVPKEKRSRLATLYLYAPNDRKLLRRAGIGALELGGFIYSATFATADKNRYRSGGGGLNSTARDYGRFLQMLLNRGELDGKRFLQPESVAEMTSNQIGELRTYLPVHGDGFGFGLGIVTGREKPASPAPPGSCSWGGIFNTFFWVDPHRQLIGIVLSQLIPYNHLPLWKDFQRKVYEDLDSERPEKEKALSKRDGPFG